MALARDGAPPSTRGPQGGAAPSPIALAFGGLVHSIQQGAFDLEGMARQALDTWLAEPDATLTLDGTNLLVNGQDALGPKAKEGRWVLPAFMAGLREIRIDEVGPEVSDLMRLAEEIAHLKPQAESIEAFRDWLWMDGAEGFTCVCEDSFTDALDAAFVDPTTAKQELLALRSEAAMSLGDSTLAVQSRDLDAAALREEFQLPLDALIASAREHGFAVDEARRAELKRGCEDPAFWVKAQVDFAAAHPALAPSLDPRKLALAVVQILKHDLDLDLVAVLGELAQRKDPFAVALAASIEREPIGETIAASVRLNEVASPEIERLLGGDRSRISQGFTHGLMERAGADRAALDATVTLVHKVGLKNVWKHLDFAKLAAPAQRGLVQVLPKCDPNPAIARDLLRNAKTAGPLLAAMPAAALMPLIGEVKSFLEKAEHGAAEPVVDALLKAGDAGTVKMLGELALARDGAGWRKQTLEPLLKALVAAGHGGELVLPLAKSKKAEPPARLVAYQALRADPALFDKAIKRSMADGSEPAQIKQWLESVRGGGTSPMVYVVAAVALLAILAAGGTFAYMKKENLDLAGLLARIKGTGATSTETPETPPAAAPGAKAEPTPAQTTGSGKAASGSPAQAAPAKPASGAGKSPNEKPAAPKSPSAKPKSPNAAPKPAADGN